ncbi:unnamed protein product [Schistosoma mattheei]|uniref:Uncharacterized protein n=1 Tax=Schistosoma mattheei TaxID=31246 RepID=A0A3P8FN39_9TREM|nr:unnamed protein product [Schistosoma mattheei]
MIVIGRLLLRLLPSLPIEEVGLLSFDCLPAVLPTSAFIFLSL